MTTGRTTATTYTDPANPPPANIITRCKESQPKYTTQDRKSPRQEVAIDLVRHPQNAKSKIKILLIDD
ncbi:hypothetical protein ANO14919_115050 [Xylariales sp. No.14919]|nr:hypothetical protein ANO14919_115050 [Xylariales sp. No.14919]